jgi:hypothetical protein
VDTPRDYEFLVADYASRDSNTAGGCDRRSPNRRSGMSRSRSITLLPGAVPIALRVATTTFFLGSMMANGTGLRMIRASSRCAA